MGRIPAYSRFQLRPAGGHICAEVTGVDLGDLDDEAFAEIERGLLGNGVLLFLESKVSEMEAQLQLSEYRFA